jgi:hypothetical protein
MTLYSLNKTYYISANSDSPLITGYLATLFSKAKVPLKKTTIEKITILNIKNDGQLILDRTKKE